MVALKILPAHLNDHPKLLKRFRREARLSASIAHPNIITVYAVGQIKGREYIAMEYIVGRNLAEFIKDEGKIEPIRAARIMRQAASALMAAHPRNVIHRDLKPANILIDNEDHQGSRLRSCSPG